MGGFRTHTAEGLCRLIALCYEREVITIADEVMTGFGRTGPLFTSLSLQHSPDIICVAKSLTGGFLTLGAIACTEKLFEGFLSSDRRKAFLHGHTYTANPIACAAALANLDLLDDPACDARRTAIEQQHQGFKAKWWQHPRLQRCDVVGTVLVLEYRDGASSYYSALRDHLAEFFLKRHVLLRPFGNSVHVIPPYCITVEELETVYGVIGDSLEEIQ